MKILISLFTFTILVFSNVNNTHLKGSLIASGAFQEDKTFKDNNNLNFTTNTLSFENLSNTTFSQNQSIGASASYSLGSSKKVDGKKVNIQAGVSNVGYNSSNGLNLSSSKTLATLGNGNITIKDIDNSDDLDRLNTDTSKINKDLYSNSTEINLDVSLDTIFPTKE